jgi:WD40 repeat protein
VKLEEGKPAPQQRTEVRLWDIATGKTVFPPLQVNDLSVWIASHGILLRPDGRQFLYITAAGIHVRDAETGEEAFVLPRAEQAYWTPDLSRFITSDFRGEECATRIWDARTGKPITPSWKNIASWSDWFTWPYLAQGAGPALSPDGARLVTWRLEPGLDDPETAKPGPGEIQVWNVRNGERLLTIPTDAPVEKAVFGLDGRRIFAGLRFPDPRPREVWCWDSDSGKVAEVKIPLVARLSSFGSTPDRSQLLTTEDDGVKVWRATDGYLLAHVPSSSSFKWWPWWLSPCGRYLLSPSRMRDLLTGTEVNVPGASGLRASSGKHNHLLSLGRDGVARIWQLGEPRAGKRQHLETPAFEPFGKWRCVSFSPDGASLAATGGLKLCVWTTRTGKKLFPDLTLAAEVHRIRFSPDGGRLLAVLDNGQCAVVNAHTGALESSLGGDPNHLVDAAFTDGGGTIVTASRCLEVQRWKAASGKADGPQQKHDIDLGLKPPYRELFSDDGSRLFLPNAKAEIVDLRTGRSVPLELSSPQYGPTRFSPDGRFLVWGGRSGMPRLAGWPAHLRAALVAAAV